MDRVNESALVPPSEVRQVGVAIHCGGGHVGILYRDSAQLVLLLDLQWHNTLRAEQPSEKYVLWTDPAITTDSADVVAAFCRRVWMRNKEEGLPYGLSGPNEFFDSTGKTLAGPAKTGLTCATFVVAVFYKAGFPLIALDTWPPPSDRDVGWQEDMADRLSENPSVSRDHVQAFRAEIGNIRFHPLDVAGAAANETIPADYESASSIGSRISIKLEEIKLGGHGGDDS